MGRPPARDLTERELEVMHVFWSQGEATAIEAPTGWRRRAWTGPTPRSPTWCAHCTRRGTCTRSMPSGRLSTGRRGRTRTYREDCSARWSSASSAVARRIALPSGRAAKLTAEETDPARTDPEGAGPMNDLGLMLLWLAVQVAFLLVPALAVHALASPRPGRGRLGGGVEPWTGAGPHVPRPGSSAARRGVCARHAVCCFGSRATGRGGDRSIPAWSAPPELDDFRYSAGLGAGRARYGRTGGANPPLGQIPGGRHAGGLGDRGLAAADRTLGRAHLPPPRRGGRRHGSPAPARRAPARHGIVAGGSSCARFPS